MMAFLLDTCLVSELWKPKPNSGVVAWLDDSVEDDLFLSVLSLGELRRGVDRLPPGKKRDRLNRDLVALRSRFSSRVLPISDVVAERWGAVSAEAGRAGKRVHVVDGLIAATALVVGLTVVTRNGTDFAPTTAPILDPWT
jgi:predicted nucleic acid-binding protein